jgi:hypothetical protein
MRILYYFKITLKYFDIERLTLASKYILLYVCAQMPSHVSICDVCVFVSKFILTYVLGTFFYLKREHIILG